MTYRALTRKQLADAYGVSSRTFRGWCRSAGISLGKSYIIPPALVQRIADTFGQLPTHYQSKS